MRRGAIAMLLGAVLAVPSMAGAAQPAIKHVFVIVLENKDYDTSFGPQAKSPQLAQTLPSQGVLLTQYYGIAHDSLPNYIAMVCGPGAQPDHAVGLPDLPGLPPGDDRRRRPGDGRGLRLPVAASRPWPTSSRAEGLTWGGYMEDMGNYDDRATRRAGTRRSTARDATQRATATDQYAARHNPFVYFHSIIDSPDCHQRDVRSTACRPTCVRRHDAEPHVHHARPVQRRPRRAVRRRASRRLRLDRRVPGRVGPADRGLARLPAGRRADRHLRRVRVGRRGLLRPGPPEHAERRRPDARPRRRPHRRRRGLAVRVSRARPATSPTTTTRCCAPSRTSSACRRSATPVARTRSARTSSTAPPRRPRARAARHDWGDAARLLPARSSQGVARSGRTVSVRMAHTAHVLFKADGRRVTTRRAKRLPDRRLPRPRGRPFAVDQGDGPRRARAAHRRTALGGPGPDPVDYRDRSGPRPRRSRRPRYACAPGCNRRRRSCASPSGVSLSNGKPTRWRPVLSSRTT